MAFNKLLRQIAGSVAAVCLASGAFAQTAYPTKPGALNYASSGPGTAYHMAGELFKAMAGIDVVHVPHKGSAEARTSVLAGDVQMMFDAITTMASLAQAGKVRAIATSGKARSSI